MELLGNAKTEYLLDASLETLHTESREWLGEITFWIEEMSFFYKLLHLREPHLSFPTERLADLEKILIQITGEQLPNLKVEVETHERSLGRIVRNNSFTEEREYRETHIKLLARIYEQQIVIRNFKKAVMGFAS